MSNDHEQSNPASEKKEIRTSKSKSVVIVSFGSIAGTVLAIVSQAIIAAKFGVGEEIDAYFTAQVVPNTLVAILVSSLGLIFIPVFSEVREQKGEDAAWQIVNYLTTNLIVLLIGVTIALFFFARGTIDLLAPGFSLEAKILATETLQIMAPIVLLSALASIVNSLLHVHNNFFYAVMGSFFGSVAYIILIIVLIPMFGLHGLAMALVGNYLFALIGRTFGLKDHLGQLKFRLGLGNKEFRNLIRLWGVLFSTSILRRITPLLERYFATQTGVGSVAYLSYGNRIVKMVDDFFSNSVATVMFPSIAKDIAQKNFEKAKSNIMLATRLNGFILVPIMTVLILLREPIIRTLLQRGVFTAENTTQVSIIFLIGTTTLFQTAAGRVISKTLYALKAVYFLGFLSIFSLIMFFVLIRIFLPVYGYVGIALASALNINWPLHYIYVRYRLGKLDNGETFFAYLRFFLLSSVMAVGLLGLQNWLYQKPDALPDIMVSIIIAAVGGLIYGGGALLFKFPEAMMVLNQTKARLEKLSFSMRKG